MKARVTTLAWAAVLCSSGCSRAPEREGQVVDQSTSPDDAAAYLNRFSGGDPDACFGQATLRKATFAGQSGAAVTSAPTRVIIAIDASGSMAGHIAGQSKLALAKTAAAAFIDDLPPEVEAGLLVFGQAGDNTLAGKASSCRAVELASPLSRDRTTLLSSVATVRPVGWTPLAAALRRAEALLAPGQKPGAQIIYVVSDGQETCGGDPVTAARTINAGPTRAVVNIIGFDVPGGEAAALAAVASAGGGRFVNSRSSREVDAVLERISENNRAARNAIARSNATASNDIQTANAAASAQICTSNIIARENIAVSNDIARKRIAGQDVAIEEEAQKRMAARHARLERRVAAFVQQAEVARDQTNAGVEAAADRVR